MEGSPAGHFSPPPPPTLAGIVYGIVHLHAHSAEARLQETRLVVDMVCGASRVIAGVFAVSTATACSPLHAYSLTGVSLPPPPYAHQLKNVSQSEPVVLMGDMNTLSPLDEVCHAADNVLQYLQYASVRAQTCVASPSGIIKCCACFRWEIVHGARWRGHARLVGCAGLTASPCVCLLQPPSSAPSELYTKKFLTEDHQRIDYRPMQTLLDAYVQGLPC